MNEKIKLDKNNGETTLMGGFGNGISGSFASNYGNIVFGGSNSVQSNYNTNSFVTSGLFGYGNKILLDRSSTSFTSSFLIGNNLLFDTSANYDSLTGCVILGKFNKTPTSLLNPCLSVGSGTNGNRKNALEINNTSIKINNNLQLATDTTEVNAITPPQDPNNVTADDKTLATVGYIQGIYQKSQVAYFSEYDTAISVPVDGTGIDIETSLGAIPSWANRLILTFRWENELFVKEIHFTKNEGVHLYVVQRAYSTFPETIAYKHLRLEWDYTNKTLTAADYWVYDQDMANAGAIANWDHTLANAPTCKILSAVYSE